MRNVFSLTVLLQLLLLVFFSSPASVSAQCSTNPELSFQNPDHESGTWGAVGSAYRFSQVLSNVDAIVTITGKNNASLYSMDLTNTGSQAAWQPQININNQHKNGSLAYLDCEVSFVVAGTTNPVVITSTVISAVDVDGDGYRLREGVGFADVNIFEMDTPTNLFAYAAGENFTMFQAATIDNQDGISVEATEQMASVTVLNSSSFQVRFQIIADPNKNGPSNATDRMFSMNFDPCIPETFVSKVSFPVEMGEFMALPNTGVVELSWTTFSELNNDRFDIQRSADGNVFYAIGTVAGNGTTTGPQSYAFLDQTAGSGVSYYRLKQIDIDGQFAYSNVVEVEMEALPVSWSVYPNPAQSEVRVDLRGEQEITAVRLLNQLGQEVEAEWSDARVMTFGDKLPTGLYFFQLQLDGSWQPSQTLLIQ